MKHDATSTDASRAYAAAYAAHYTARDLPLAIRLYKDLMASHAGSQEADYCRMQMQNIMNSVLPKQELLESQVELILHHFEHNGDLDIGQSRIVPLAVGTLS